MRDTRLIFVEGIMGAGKSTTAAFLTDQLHRSGLSARLMLEGPTLTEPRHPLRVATDLPHPNAAWRDVTVADFIERSMGKRHIALCDDLFALLPMPKLAIPNQGDWTTYYRDILAFLQVPAQPIDRSPAD